MSRTASVQYVKAGSSGRKYSFSMKNDEQSKRYPQFIKTILNVYPVKINELFIESGEA